ncbi:MAG: PH domain-containing protein [Hyphomicrobiales bacterium]
MGTARFFDVKEIKELFNILWEDKAGERLAQGMYGNGMGILCSTNKQLIFVEKGMLYGLKIEDFSYDKITSIQ